MNKRFSRNFKFLRPAKNNDGFALVTVLVLSAVLMATMAIVMNSATMETVMSGAGTFSKMALSRADAGVEYVRGIFNLVGYNDPLNPFDSPYVAENDPYLPIRKEYILDRAKVTYLNEDDLVNKKLEDFMTNSQISYTLSVSRITDNSLLAGTGFSNKYKIVSAGGGGMTLSAYPCRITSTGVAALYSKTIEVEGFNLAP